MDRGGLIRLVALRVAWPGNARYGNDVFNGSLASTDNGRLSG